MATGDSLEVDDLELLAENDSISFELGCASTSAIIERASETRDTGPYSCSSVSTPQPTLLGSHSTRSMDKIPLLKKRKIAHDNLMTKMILNVDKGAVTFYDISVMFEQALPTSLGMSLQLYYS